MVVNANFGEDCRGELRSPIIGNKSIVPISREQKNQ